MDHGNDEPDSAAGSFVIDGCRLSAPALDPALYVVATPIGNLGDVTIRALKTLATADWIACEDKRITVRLLNRYGIKGRMTVYHEHNAHKAGAKLLAALAGGGAVALVSDAGTPLISDPGQRLVESAVAAGHTVVSVPGPSAAIAALSACAMPTERFLFAGFLPTRAGKRDTVLAELASLAASLVFYESPNRLAASLAAMAHRFGMSRPAAVGRELTKRHETIVRGTLGELAEHFASHDLIKGECVVVVSPPQRNRRETDIDIEAALLEALETMSVAKAAGEIAHITGQSRNEIYRRALQLRHGQAGQDGG